MVPIMQHADVSCTTSAHCRFPVDFLHAAQLDHDWRSRFIEIRRTSHRIQIRAIFRLVSSTSIGGCRWETPEMAIIMLNASYLGSLGL